MTYNELKQIAQPHIREGENLPSNAFLLLTQLHIPFKTQKQCEDDYKGEMTPLYNHPAFLADHHGERVLYFNSNTRYWNFYIFHEIAHYILGHENDSPQNEIDADMLACILAAPIENLPTNIKTARELSTLASIPIDKAEVYWHEIRTKFPNPYKKLLVFGSTGIALLLFLMILIFSMNTPTVSNNTSNVINISTPTPTSENKDENNSQDKFFITSSGERYHKRDCQYIKDKENVISVSLEEAKKLEIEPCKKCIK